MLKGQYHITNDRHYLYTPLEEDGISFYADGSVRVDSEKNELLL